MTGLARYFETRDVIAREHASPKPKPDGIRVLLERWRAPRGEAVMVGDGRWDLLAGRAAQVATVYVDPSGRFPLREHADHIATDLHRLREWLAS